MDELKLDSNLSVKAVHDYHLIRAALDKGDQKAYAELMGRYRDSIYFMLLKMIRNKDDAEDLTIESFSKAFKRLDQYSPTFAFSTWLFKIASNNCIDFIRRKKMLTLSIDNAFENKDAIMSKMELKAEGLNPEESMEKKQKVRHMREIVAKLKPHYRVLVELRFFEELTYEEIAEKLELPLGTVKARLFRAREFLSNVMKNLEGKV